MAPAHRSDATYPTTVPRMRSKGADSPPPQPPKNKPGPSRHVDRHSQTTPSLTKDSRAAQVISDCCMPCRSLVSLLVSSELPWARILRDMRPGHPSRVKAGALRTHRNRSREAHAARELGAAGHIPQCVWIAPRRNTYGTDACSFAAHPRRPRTLQISQPAAPHLHPRTNSDRQTGERDRRIYVHCPRGTTVRCSGGFMDRSCTLTC